jgi:hypothetical protein
MCLFVSWSRLHAAPCVCSKKNRDLRQLRSSSRKVSGLALNAPTLYLSHADIGMATRACASVRRNCRLGPPPIFTRVYSSMTEWCCWADKHPGTWRGPAQQSGGPAHSLPRLPTCPLPSEVLLNLKRWQVSEYEAVLPHVTPESVTALKARLLSRCACSAMLDVGASAWLVPHAIIQPVWSVAVLFFLVLSFLVCLTYCLRLKYT